MGSATAAPVGVPASPKRQSLGTFYLRIYRQSPWERVEAIKLGLPASEAKRILVGFKVGQGALLRALDLSPATLNKRAKRGQALPVAESERVLGIARLVGQVETMVEESGSTDGFDAAAWLSGWLTEPVPALGSQRPLDLLDTMEGQGLVSKLLAQMQSGAYA